MALLLVALLLVTFSLLCVEIARRRKAERSLQSLFLALSESRAGHQESRQAIAVLERRVRSIASLAANEECRRIAAEQRLRVHLALDTPTRWHQRAKAPSAPDSAEPLHFAATVPMPLVP